jgi:hypothetical protein
MMEDIIEQEVITLSIAAVKVRETREDREEAVDGT